MGIHSISVFPIPPFRNILDCRACVFDYNTLDIQKFNLNVLLWNFSSVYIYPKLPCWSNINNTHDFLEEENEGLEFDLQSQV
jgi:hypothetical protein